MWDMKEYINGWIKDLYPYVLVILIVILIRIFIITPVRVNGSSMEPTLYDKEVLILEKFNRFYDRFDVIVLNYKKEKLVKRVIGLPGEHIEYKDNILYVNGVKVSEDFINDETLDFDLRQLDFNIIPDDYYFVMGDNRNNSTDSRYIGLINKNNIVGTVRIIVYPFDRFGLIKE